MFLKYSLPVIILSAFTAILNLPEISKTTVPANPAKALSVTCNNWLNTPDKLTGVTIGELDITGNQLTVEAMCNASDIYDLSRALVSKHGWQANCNYFLCPDLAQITTSDGFFSASSPCSFESNKTYHVAMVYNGSSLKLYRNGFLMQEVPASGNLVNNNWPATIGEYAYAMYYGNASISNIFKGYINEVRIWNVARTQQEIRDYMNTSLPEPTTQNGLLAYYTFDDLKNKQGNSLYDGTLNGAATINSSNPNCNFVVDSCGIIPGAGTVNCSAWLKTPDKLTGVSIGELDITGDQITVEAMCNASDIYDLSRALVSKHGWEANCNYFLCPDLAQITTSNGFFSASSPCSFVSNKTYHVAMVYNGSSLKLYRNGFLMQEVPASGSLVNNNWPATIGEYAYAMYYGNASISNIFKGYINEVRIWNVARTQQEIRDYMNTSLPEPTTQNGLLAYYTFDDLKNKQGNSLYDGTLKGAATINNENPNCDFVADSCQDVTTPDLCNSWLKTPDKLTGVTIGELDITGDHLTVEAMCNASDIYDLSRALVSKHGWEDNCNYFLCPDLAQITTSNGFFSAASPCTFASNKTYHVAMVYNGSSLKLYRNGILMQEVAATGNLITNDWPATIGEYAYAMYYGNAGISNIFKGYINEVRIWNVARTEQQIKDNMTTTLPSPTTQNGLLAYYTFDDLKNKQGNTAYNGVLNGGATIGNTNPTCGLAEDPCSSEPPVCKATILTSGETTFCAGGSVTLTASAGKNYLWSTGETTRDITVTGNGSYSVTVTNAVNCSATSEPVIVTVNPQPVTPTVTANGPLEFCNGGSVTLTSSVADSYLWSNGATTQSISATSSAFYSVVTKNNTGCISATSTPIQVTTKSCDGSYCAASGSNKEKGYINKVYFREIANVSGWNGGYGDFTALTAGVTKCNQYTIGIVPGSVKCKNKIYTKVWIDWNQDGDFNDRTEMVFSNVSRNNTITGKISIPSNAKPGKTRMRISLREGCHPSPCCSFKYGEVEDYSILVEAPGNSNTITSKPSLPSKAEPVAVKYNLFPNPATNSFVITKTGISTGFEKANTNVAVMSITDASGKLVMQKRITATRETVDVSNFANGTYFVRIQHDGKLTVQQIVVHH